MLGDLTDDLSGMSQQEMREVIETGLTASLGISLGFYGLKGVLFKLRDCLEAIIKSADNYTAEAEDFIESPQKKYLEEYNMILDIIEFMNLDDNEIVN